jgi:hypothetical protein
MKTKLCILLTAVSVLFFTYSTYAQKKKEFQGVITYDITYPGASLTPAQKAQLPVTQDMTVKGCKTKTEIVSGMASQAEITDGATKSVIGLIDYMGTKYALKKDSNEISKDFSKLTIKVTPSTDTKVIAEYTCKKAIVTITDEDGTVTNDTLFYTEEIGCSDLNFSTEYKDIPGAILEYSMYVAQIDTYMKYTAKTVKKTKVSDNIFLIPSDFQEVTKEELKKALGIE